MNMAPHGGRLRRAASRWRIPYADWLDLSTGIAPWSWPVPSLPEAVWARLPEADDGLIAAAAGYYRLPAARLLPVPGSQFAISEWPRLLAPGRVAVPAIGYREHARCWAAAGHELCFYDDWAALQAMAAQSPSIDHAVVLAPNNPTADWPDREQLTALAERLGPGGLVIDAAFVDCQNSAPIFPENAIVLRSVGKFFGLAGIRLGFVIADPSITDSLSVRLGPWGVAHPTRWIGARALVDTSWQNAQRRRIAGRAEWLHTRLCTSWPQTCCVSGGLFVTLFFDAPDEAPFWHTALAQRGVLTRLGDSGHWLRFGLPDDAGQTRLDTVLDEIMTS